MPELVTREGVLAPRNVTSSLRGAPQPELVTLEGVLAPRNVTSSLWAA